MGVTVKKCHMIMSGNDCWNSVCFTCCRKADNELADVTLSGRLFQNCAAATGNITHHQEKMEYGIQLHHVLWLISNLFGFKMKRISLMRSASSLWQACIFYVYYYLVMAALWNRTGHYIVALWFLSSIFYLFSSPNLSGRRLDVYHTSTHGVALVWI